MRVSDTYKPLCFVLTAALCAVGTWTYAHRVLIAHQVRYDAEHGKPRGYLSDLYPRWFGAKELLLHGQDPYSPEFTSEIQVGYYGRPLASEGAEPRNYQQGFYYPVYVAFLLAPTIHLPFEVVQKGFFWVLLGLSLATIPLWPRLLGWSVPLWEQASLALFAMGSLPFIEGLLLQQITLFVIPLLTAAMMLLVWDRAWVRQVLAGILLALATIKPQLIFLLLIWLAIWTFGDWRRRYRWAASFLLTMTVLCGASESYLPHWIPRFWQALWEYRRYTGEMSVTDELIGGTWGRVLEVSAIAVMIGVCWKERRCAANTDAFAFTFSLVMATTVLVAPTYGLYNQVLLIPALLVMLKERRTIWERSRVSRVLSAMTAGCVVWPWTSGVLLAGLSFVLPREIVERAWAVPLWAALQTPLAVTALMLVHYYQRAHLYEKSAEFRAKDAC